MSSAYADGDGRDGAIAVQMAIDDFGGKLLGKPVELLSMDHQNKPDIAATKAREWFDNQNLKMLVAGANSGAGLAMAGVAAEKKFVLFANGADAATRAHLGHVLELRVHRVGDVVALDWWFDTRSFESYTVQELTEQFSLALIELTSEATPTMLATAELAMAH